MCGVYVHIPFCIAKCAYCDFNSYPGCESLFAPYLRALRTEARLLRQRVERDCKTLYFGGGTPTVLPNGELAALVIELRGTFAVPPDGEVTVEANPGTVTEEGLRRLRKAGVNRISLGVQSFDDTELRLLGRIHSAADAIRAVRDARAAGFDNLNLDLILGLPGQSMQRWQENVRRALELAPQHLSLYALTIEEGTPLADQVLSGTLPAPDDDLAAEMYEWAAEVLAKAGYEHYEISNWARPGYECRHNLIYWYNRPYIGLGAGAHSWWGGERWHNLARPEEYIAALKGGHLPIAGREAIPRALEMGETMMMGLRLLREGVSFARFARRFGVSPAEAYADALARLIGAGLLECDGKRVRLARHKWLLGNLAFAAFLP